MYKLNLLRTLDIAALPFHLACVSAERDEKENTVSPVETGRMIHDLLCLPLAHEHLVKAMEESLRQSSLQVWECFEMFLREFYVALLNHQPLLSTRLLKTGGDLFDRQIDMDDLSKFGFNLSDHLGDLFTRHHDHHAVPFIKRMAKALFPNNSMLHAALANPLLLLLHQRRNLIVHQRGIVNERYLDRTDEHLTPGEEIVITPAELEEYLLITMKAVTEFLVASKNPIP